jgi:Fe-S cluster assembly protein SufD
MTVQTLTLPEVGLNQAAVEGLSAQRREPEWFLDLRRRAWRFFEEIAWPTGEVVVWRRTRLTGLNIDYFRLP